MKRRAVLLSLIFFPIAASCQKPAESAPQAAGEGTAEVTPATATPRVRLKTNLGDIVLELDREKAPISVENFLTYVKDGHYDGTVFHRVIDGFMIQGGGMELKGEQLVEKKTRAPIKNEGQNGLKNDRGTIAMARTPDLDSATSQFFINVVDNHGLNYPRNGGYAVFGKVVEGMDVVDRIRAVPTGGADVPVKPVVIESAKTE
jgi:peptidyl-prolyl cis-trans isomerase A (cyclophilin A)